MLIAGYIHCLLLTIITTVVGAQADDKHLEDKITWLRENAEVVRSIDYTDDDFSDLEPLVEHIGDAQIVQLGESSHGAGAAFQAKVRLIAFLHQRLGFDVLVWESGMHGCSIVDRELRAGTSPKKAGPLGIFTLWVGTEEGLPALSYAQQTHATDRPLEIAGFDLQFSGLNGFEQFAGDLRDHFRGLDEGPVREDLLAAAEFALETYATMGSVQEARGEFVRGMAEDMTREQRYEALMAWEEEYYDVYAVETEVLDDFTASTQELKDLMDKSRAALNGVHGERRASFLRRCVDNFSEFGITHYERNAKESPRDGPELRKMRNRGWNRRDRQCGDNMVWFANDYYRDRKIIVWAHNGHVMNCYYKPDWSGLTLEPQPEGMKPMAIYMNEELGDRVYTIGFTAYQGSQREQGGYAEFPIREAPEGSLEHAMHLLGQPHLFVDFRHLDDQPDHWLRQPMNMAIRGYMSETMPDWTRVVDAMFFNDRMTPSHWLER